MPTPTFPVKTSEMLGKGYGILPSTPYGNTFTLEMAKAAVENEKLGQDEVTDFLALSFSSPDYIGHRFGPNAVETEDMYLRLDVDLADLFSFLDTRLGKGNYTAFLTADHGAANNVNFLTDHKIPAGLWSSGATLAALNKKLEATHGVNNLVLSLMSYQVHLNYKAIANGNLNEEQISKDCVAFLKTQPNIAFVVDLNRLGDAVIPDELKSRITKGYNAERSGSIQIILRPGWFSGSATGTSHGTWSPNDAHIPLLWMGWGIKRGSMSRQIYMTDIAPTLAALLRIQMPNGCIGKSISEVLVNDIVNANK
jgi:predicted AlkP superfamily pyrophosphatase or phosphodiesterase